MIGACSALQTCILLSLLAETMRLPSGDHITVPTRSVWPRYVAICLPLATSHICTALSSLVEAMRLPSGHHAIALTQPSCPRYLEALLPFVAFHTCTSCKEPEAMNL